MYGIKAFTFDILISRYYNAISHPTSNRIKTSISNTYRVYDINANIYFLAPKQEPVFHVHRRLTAMKIVKWTLTLNVITWATYSCWAVPYCPIWTHCIIQVLEWYDRLDEHDSRRHQPGSGELPQSFGRAHSIWNITAGGHRGK